MNKLKPFCGLAVLAVAACAQADRSAASPDNDPAPTTAAATPVAEPQPIDDDAGEDTARFDEISASETVRFTGTEPFWGGQVVGTALTYSTPEIPDGTDIAVTRFAGRGGVSWTGTYSGARFTLAVTPGKCSDGMSDRTYPYVATLEVAGEQRSGCAWTERKSFSGPTNP